MSYSAIVARVSTRPHPNADRLQLGMCRGYQVIVGMDTEDGELGVLFPPDGQLSHEYCMANNLYARHPETGEKMGGFFGKNRRVVAQRFRGEKSEAYWAPLHTLDNMVKRPSIHKASDLLKEGEEITHYRGTPLCQKYETPATRHAREHRASQPRRSNSAFRKHFDTPQLRKEIREIPDGALIYMTEKLHGCVSHGTYITMADGSKKRITEVRPGDEVFGVNEDGELVSSKVLAFFNNGKANEGWYKVEGTRSVSGGLKKFSVVCTPDHMFWVPEDGWVKSCDLSEGDSVVMSHYGRGLSEVQYQILLGMMLGDAHIDKRAGLRKIQWGHAEKYEEYMDWIDEGLGDLSNIEVRRPISGYGTTMVRAKTPHSIHIRLAFQDFIGESGKKVVPGWVAKRISPLGLAFWYMDDGSLVHKEGQVDRAQFAVCGFSREDCDVLLRALDKFGCRGTITGESGRLRLTISAHTSDVFFGLIAPYIPPCMQYKLPEQWRGGDGWLPIQHHGFNPAVTEEIITSVEPVDFYSLKYDLETETHNYFANGVLTHNTSGRFGYLPEYIEPTLRQKLGAWIAGGAAESTAREYLLGTRNVILGKWEGDSYYGNEGFRYALTDPLKGKLHYGETLYFEIVGYTEEGAPIMPPVDTSALKGHKVSEGAFTSADFHTLYGPRMHYSYGCLRGTADHRMYVYRITQLSLDGVPFDLSWEQVKGRCAELGVDHVPELRPGPAMMVWGETEEDNKKAVELCLEDAEFAARGPSTVDNKHIREGVCIRWEKGTRIGILKHKSLEFEILEGITKADDLYIDREGVA